jgi:uroporphyrinogen decarboxylase
VQVSAAGMDPARLARDFKGRIAFHGAIGTQKSLPNKSSDEIRREVRETIALLGPTGFVAAPDQNIQDGTSLENIFAMMEAIHNYRVS